MLEDIDQVCRNDARRILQLLCVAKRPLSVRELIDGNAVELGDDPRVNKTRRLRNAYDIQRICPFVTISDMSKRWDPTLDHLEEVAIVRLAHYSVQEYLESPQILQDEKVKIFGVQAELANTDSTKICLTYLLDAGLAEAMVKRSVTREYPLAIYAARFWLRHLDQGSHDDAHICSYIEERLFSTGSDFTIRRNILEVQI